MVTHFVSHYIIIQWTCHCDSWWETPGKHLFPRTFSWANLSLNFSSSSSSTLPPATTSTNIFALPLFTLGICWGVGAGTHLFERVQSIASCTTNAFLPHPPTPPDTVLCYGVERGFRWGLMLACGRSIEGSPLQLLQSVARGIKCQQIRLVLNFCTNSFM